MDSISARLSTAYATAYAPYMPPPPRRASTTSSSNNTDTTTTMPFSPTDDDQSQDAQRRSSVPTTTTTTHNPSLYPVRTRSLGGYLSAGVIFERDPTAPPSEEDIIIVTVRVTKRQRRNSFDDPLPDRPPPRSFLRRMSTRLHSAPSATKYKAVKMPRGDYARYFRYDAAGRYAGTEPEREWEEEEVMRKYAQYQDLPLRSVLGRGTMARDVPVCGWGA